MDRFDHPLLVRLAQSKVQGKPKESVANTLCDRAITCLPPKALAHLGRVERNVVKHAMYTQGAKVPNHPVALVGRWK